MQAIGSYVDLVRFLSGEAKLPDDGSYLVEGRLVVVSSVAPTTVEEWFVRPDQAVAVIAGLRAARPLADPDGHFRRVQERAEAFSWDETMRARAKTWVGEQMVGWVEEVYKGLEGLKRHDVGRLLNARFGLSWGLSRVLLVYHGILLHGDNTFYDQLTEVLGEGSSWSKLRRQAFGIPQEGEVLPLRRQVTAGLRLYALTAEMVEEALTSEQATLVSTVVAEIHAVLEGN